MEYNQHEFWCLEDLAWDAYGNEELVPECVHDAVTELMLRGYSKDELFNFCTFGSTI